MTGVSSLGGGVVGAYAPAAPPLLNVAGLSKRYGGVQALRGVGLDVHEGTVHAVVGENGAGKSTLMKILAGVVRPDAGSISLAGKAIQWSGPLDAARSGIGIVFQELSSLPTRDALANLFVNNEITRFGMVSRRAMAARARPILEALGLKVDLDDPVGGLPVADRQLLEIARVLIAAPKVLLLDEPNSALNQRETERLFKIVRVLCQQGVTILYVSHRLEEVFDIADEITVMRDGAVLWTKPTRDTAIPDVIHAMLGHKAEALFPDRPDTAGVPGAPLIVEGLRVRGGAADINFEARPGEVLGVAGLDGSGADSLLLALFGRRAATSRRIAYPDGRTRPESPNAAARRGIALVPADRRREGLMLDKSIAVNGSHVAVGANGRWWRPVMLNALKHRARSIIGDLGVRTRSSATVVGELSGGNQQKIVVGKWLEIGPGVVLLDDPTRGIDVGAKSELFVLIRQMQAAGKIILFRSTELPELLGMCDRVLIFYRRRLAGIAETNALDDKGLLAAINTGQISA